MLSEYILEVNKLLNKYHSGELTIEQLDEERSKVYNNMKGDKMPKVTMNRLANAQNQFQDFDKYKRVLCVCSAGLLRSPTAALVLSQSPYDYNTRCAGLNDDMALVQVDDVLLSWADEIVCMSLEQQDILMGMTKKPIVNLDIPDRFGYRDPQLMQLIKDNYDKKTKK